MSATFVEAQHAAELALAAMALRSLLSRELDTTPEVVSLRFTVSVEGIDVEVTGVAGLPLGGYSL